MTHSDLLHALPDARLPAVRPWADTSATAVCIDSRKAIPGCLFVCVPGTRADGRRFAAAALSAGAACLAGEGEAPEGIPPGAWIAVPDARLAVARLACAFHEHPSRRLQVLAVTGTNGKTTTATLLQAALNAAGLRCGLLSTVRCDLGDATVPAEQTTPDATLLQQFLARMLRAGCHAASLEVSSHALLQHRVAGIRLAAAAFTNLTQDHLDYHGTMAAYALAKRRLFEQLAESPGGTAVVNRDDPWGRELIAWLKSAGVPTLTYGLDGPADFQAEAPRLDTDGSRFHLQTPQGRIELASPLLGRHNLSNLLAAAALASTTGAPLEPVAAALARQPPVRGRLERVETPEHPAAWFVDYAHTPDALARALDTLRPLTRGRLLVVFGCGGDRDRGKRPLMGRIAHARADLVIVTSDNPRSEEPAAILAEILAGLPPKASTVSPEPDRRNAIRRAAQLARNAGDVVLIAGKGHETTQVFADRTVHFDDREEVRLATGPALPRE